MLKTLVFVTNNLNKFREVRNGLDYRIQLLSLSDIGHVDIIEETASSIEGNALLKAKTIYQKYGLDCFADDTGLEVKALNCQPGVYSNRYSGELGNSKVNIQKILKELEGKIDNSARFKTIIALIFQGKEILFEGIVEGKIIKEEKGIFGFGYDSIFVPVGYTQTFAEMDEEVKNTISHRAKAVYQLKKFLFHA